MPSSERRVWPTTARTALRPVHPLPPLGFPDALPVSASRDEIAAAIRAHPVVIVCGETGSGKTTQLPKICALAGRGTRGLIGHTQPRRLAATSVARRIAEELGTPLGVNVGYKIRFNERFATGATIKLMTDGILLSESLSDPALSQYDTLIIDEAHERSLNIDFLLGYLKQLLDGPRRGDLKVVVTSATIDAERFSRHFADGETPAPVIEVSGRVYPVEIRYAEDDDPEEAAPGGGERSRAGPMRERRDRRDPVDEDDDSDLPSRIEDTLALLWREGPGDVLVFLPGEREIRDTADHLRRAIAREQSRPHAPLGRAGIEILPLFSRLSAAEQDRVFTPGAGLRVVLATNVAETSLTVPGIRYVIDSGLARVKRYRYRGKVEQLQIEPVSQAAANQRAGRCGRVRDGVCVRLYSRGDFERRPRYTDPEVLRSSLAAVILRMKALHLADIGAFPFIDPPPRKAIADGHALLRELAAVDEDHRLTPIGRQLSRLPVDPRIGRMLLAANETHSLRELLVIAAALSSQDPRERPLDAQQAADQQHRRFQDEHSDFLSYVKLWDYWQAAQSGREAAGESKRRLAARMEREFLSNRKLREWADVHGQLCEAVAALHWKANATAATYEQVHRALLAGLLGNLGTRQPEDTQYTGTHSTCFILHPSSGLTRKPPRWAIVAEMVDTGRLYGRTAARVDPVWIEQIGAHLIQRSWGDPVWSKQAGQVIAYERGVIYGLVLYAQRRVNAGARDPVAARATLIREALVQGNWLDPPDDRRLPFLAHNRALIAEIQKLEHKIRRPDLLVDEDFVFAWFDRRVPAEVWSGKSLETWYLEASREDPALLMLSREELLRKESGGISSESFPRRIAMRGAELGLDYHFDPGADDDGVTLVVPLHLLNQIDEVRTQWLVPGMLRDKVTALVRSLPQRVRRHLMPIASYVDGFVLRMGDRGGTVPLLDALTDDIAAQATARPAAGDFKLEQVPAHLFMNFRLTDPHGGYLAQSRHLAQLRADHGQQAKGAFQGALREVLRGASRARSPDASTRLPAPFGGTAVAVGLASDTRAAAPGESGLAGGTNTGRSPGLTARAGGRSIVWDFGPLPELLELEHVIEGRPERLIGYPALVDHGDSVELAVFDEPDAAHEAHRRGLRRLFALALREPLRFFERNIPEFTRLAMLYLQLGVAEDLRAQLIDAVIERACMMEPWPVDRDAFEARAQAARPRLNLIGQELARLALAILGEYAAVLKRLAVARRSPQAVNDIEQQLATLLPRRFLLETPAARLGQLPRYLKAVVARLDRFKADPQRDARQMAAMSPLQTGYRRTLAARKGRPDQRLDEFGWLLQELRVSLFAQELRTPMPVSVKRLEKAWAAISR